MFTLNPNIKPSPLASKVLKKLLEGRNVFLTGAGGMGKSHLTRELISFFPNPLVLGSTNLAATILGGSTVHSAFCLYNSKNIRELQAKDRDRIKRISMSKGVNINTAKHIYFSKIKKVIQATNVIFIDEISMLSAEVFDAMHYRIHSLMGDDYNIPMIVIGDFFQLPPVKSSMCYTSKNWDFFIIELAEMKRSSNKSFTAMLSDLRKGYYSKRVKNFIDNHSVDYEEPPLDMLRVYPKNDACADHHKLALHSLKGKTYKFRARINNIANLSPDKVQDFMEKGCPAEPLVQLKVGAKIIFVVNYQSDQDDGYYNGETGKVLAINKADRTILVQKGNGKKITVGEFIFTKERYDTISSNQLRLVKELEVTQIPLKLAYAMTVHKTQGMSIKEPLYVNCSKMWKRNQGLVYVALSRVTSPDLIYISDFQKKVHLNIRRDIAEFYKEEKRKGNLVRYKGY